MYAVLVLAVFAQAPQPQPKVKPVDPLSYLSPFVADAVKPDPNDSELRKLQKERTRERATYLGRMKEVIEIGRWDSEYFTDELKTRSVLYENLAELMDKPADKVKCSEMRVESLKEFEKFTTIRVDTGSDPPQRLNLVRAARIDAEIDLLKLKETLKGGK